MAAISLFWDTNMAAVTSCENTLFCVLVLFSNSFSFIFSTDFKTTHQLSTTDGTLNKQ